MPTPDPQTVAPRSGLVPQCAKRGKPLACLFVLFSACLNPMPEEFPSNDDLVPQNDEPGSSSSVDEANGTPILPNPNDPGDIFGGGAGSGGSGGNGGPPLTQPPSPVGNGGEGEPAAPDAGADAGAPRAEATGTEEGETTP